MKAAATAATPSVARLPAVDEALVGAFAQNDVTAHGDLVESARLAERAGVDLRVVLLVRRDFAACVLGRTGHKENADASFVAHARVLRDSECILAGQIRSLDRRFVRVLEYEALVASPKAEAPPLARFLRADEALLAGAFARYVRASKAPPPTPRQRALVDQLRHAGCALAR